MDDTSVSFLDRDCVAVVDVAEDCRVSFDLSEGIDWAGGSRFLAPTCRRSAEEDTKRVSWWPVCDGTYFNVSVRIFLVNVHWD